MRTLLSWQGLRGARRFAGTSGMLAYIRQAGCVQYDPLDVCGRNAELVLQSRVKGFTPSMLYDALYKRRALFDYWDKNMAIMPIEDWPHFARTRAQWRAQPWERSRGDIVPVLGEVRAQIAQRGPLFSADIALGKQVDWAWAPTSLSRAAMETLFYEGELMVHHKKGTLRAFDLTSRTLPAALQEAPDPFAAQEDFEAWRVARRVAAIGLLWNRPSDAMLGTDLKAAARARAFDALADAGRIVPVTVEGIDPPCYLPAEALPTLEAARRARTPQYPRTELLAPLDNLLWDRNLIEALFGFYYRWEVYTPVAQRQYGYYVLPVLQGDALVGRMELVRARKENTLCVKGAWWERETDLDGVADCLARFAAMLGLNGWTGDIGGSARKA